MEFKLKSPFLPKGNQPEAISLLCQGVSLGKKAQVLLGITGSGKTYTIANVVQNINKPTLILAHNKTLAAQLYEEFKAFFPENAVEYFVSYYDYYQPEAYIARTDTYIEKDMAINERIEKLRLSATRSLLEREDVLIVASVSCIYGLGMPEYYAKMRLRVECGMQIRRDELLLRLVSMHYKRNDYDFVRGNFRARGDVLEVFPAYEDDIAYRIEFLGDEIERLSIIEPLTGSVQQRPDNITIYPGSHFVTPEDVRFKAIQSIEKELKERADFFEKEGLLIERQRILERTKYDMEMMREVGSCKGIENYSYHFSQRGIGDPPSCLIDYFPDDFLLVVDESHQTIPQIHAMYNGDRARKEALVAFGFRLPSAFDNRPLKFPEFYNKINRAIYVSATPGKWEILEAEGVVVEQIIRPTGLLDPLIEIRSARTQVDDCIHEIREEIKKGHRILVTTITKKLSEELASYLSELDIKAKYLHSDIDTIERVEIIRDLRRGIFDVLVGINLLREGLDIPEVALVAILDADKEGFLRSETALIQTCGRASRNSKGRVILYADKETTAIKNTVQITLERRKFQEEYNKKHGITPTTVIRTMGGGFLEAEVIAPLLDKHVDVKELNQKIVHLEKEMKKAAKEWRFEEAATFRDEIQKVQKLLIFYSGSD